MDLGGAEIRNGKLFAANMRESVEANYKVAYNLGCGKKKWTGWIGVDISEEADLRCDLRTLDIDTETADAIAAIHVLEHFYVWEALDLILEWKRVLKPGGVMILELPCFDKIFDYIAECRVQNQPMEMFMTWLPLFGDPKHMDEAMCHKWGYTASMAVNLLDAAGMREIKVLPAKYHFPFRDMRIEAIK
jgi:SAM-dependent methyltransferase